MLPIKQIKQLLRFTHPDLCEVVLELRNLAFSVVPYATEEIRPGGLVYYHGASGGPVSAGICGITIKPDHIRLYFTHGAFIPDPKRLLKGSGKAMRFIRLDNYQTVPWEDIRALVAEHANFDPRSFSIS
jgi:hypothetical protein